MKQSNHTWLDAVKYAPHLLTADDLEEMAALADSVPELETRCEELEAERDDAQCALSEFHELECERDDLRAFIEDCFARITSFAPYHESMEEIKAAILADIDQRSV